MVAYGLFNPTKSNNSKHELNV